MKNVVFLLISTVISGLYATTARADKDSILTGTVIGTLQSVDYGSNTPSTKVNTRECAFDGNLNTYFAAYDRSFAWVGLDLGEPFVITRIGWAPANRNRGDESEARASTEPSCFMSQMGNPMSIHYPEDDEITSQQKTYVENCFNTMEENWKEYLDLNTFLRHFFVGELSGNTDTYWSTYMYKHRGNDTIYVGPVWDFDLAFENDKRTYPIFMR